MIEMSPEEFEGRVEDLIEGKKSRVKFAEELDSDIRTIERRIITEISINNPDLYIEYIKQYPYKQKKRDDIDYEALVIEMIKNRTHTIDAANKYGLGVRTIQRRVNSIEKENPYLIEIYKYVKRSNKNNSPIPSKIQEKIDMLVESPVKISDRNDTRKKQLEEIERVFNNRCQYVSKQEAAKTMGMSMHRIYTSLNELYKIRIEENSRRQNQFKEDLKVDGVGFAQIPTADSSGTTSMQIGEKGE